MNKTHQLLYTTSRCNQQNGFRVITQEYIVNGYAIVLRTRMTKNPAELACFIGLIPDALSSKLEKVREFSVDFITQYLGEDNVKKISSEKSVNGTMPTKDILAETKPLFDQLLYIADALTKTKH